MNEKEMQLFSIRIKFSRGEEVKYISHLDMMKTFERAIRRSRLPIAYSQGFNPHPKMVFGLPLSVGVTSSAEYADFELEGNISPEELKSRLNEALPPGIEVREADVKKDRSNIMAAITKASYQIAARISGEEKRNGLKGMIDELLGSSAIWVKKETKSGTKDVDIRPGIFSLDVQKSWSGNRCQETLPDERIVFNMLVSAGSVSNIKPELVISTINERFQAGIEIEAVHRTGLYFGEGNDVIDPLNPVFPQS